MGLIQLVLLGKIGKLLLRPQHVVIGDPKGINGINSPNTMVDQWKSNHRFRSMTRLLIVDVQAHAATRASG
ncbi:hypothetical protein Tco_1376206 [Tanacetum coccineum]